MVFAVESGVLLVYERNHVVLHNGTLDVEGNSVDLHPGNAVFVPASAEHRLSGYEQRSVLLIFEKTCA
jgi:mannose-6-phosphate isomerase-like protein (cupin superfamily)